MWSYGNKYQYICLYKENIIKTSWSNKSPQQYDIQFRSQHIISKCNTCLNNNNDNTPIHLTSLNN